jgi:hypothetical protein
MWDHWNRILHDTDVNMAEQQQCKEVEDEFGRGAETVTKEAKRLFRPGLRNILALPPAAKQAWLIRVKNARARYHELPLTRHTYLDKRQGMGRWLQIPKYTQ